MRRYREKAKAVMTEADRVAERAKWRAYKKEMKERDPEAARLQKRAINRRYDKRRELLLGKDAVRELRRISDKERRERKEGKRLKTKQEVYKRPSRSGERLPIGPWRAWVKEVERQQELREVVLGDSNAPTVGQVVADILGVNSRRVYEWLYVSKEIDYVTVDQATTRYGDITPEQVYWEYGRIKLYGRIVVHCIEPATSPITQYYVGPPVQHEEVKQVQTEEPVTKPCKTPKCSESISNGGRFCPSCAERLARIKAELDGTTAKFQATIKRKNARPTCCNPGCRQERLRGDRYCDDCQADGWTEDEIE